MNVVRDKEDEWTEDICNHSCQIKNHVCLNLLVSDNRALGLLGYSTQQWSDTVH